MTETSTPPDDAPEPPAGGAPAVGQGTDIDAADLDVSDGAGDDVPATSDPEELTDDGGLGGTSGGNAGGAG